MTTLLTERYRQGRLSHATILIATSSEASRLVAEFIEQLELSPADYQLFKEDIVIKISDARLIRRFVGMTRYNSPIKLVFIADARQLTSEAASALLKLLEEPPPETYFILATTQLDELLPTVRSRCQVIEVEREVSPSESVPHLTATSLARYFEISKKLAENEVSLPTILESWLRQFDDQPKKQQIILDYLPAAQTNVSRRLLLDNLVLELYTKG